jgi:hypothetical protein
LEALCDALARPRMLIHADNGEHPVPAYRQLFTALSRAAPGLRVPARSPEVRSAGMRPGGSAQPGHRPPAAGRVDVVTVARCPDRPERGTLSHSRL